MVDDILVVGSGPAGLTAAIYASREGFSTSVVEGASPGGQLLLTTVIENYPGFAEGISGPELMDIFRKQAERFGAKFIGGEATDLDLSKRPFVVKIGGSTHEAKCLIIATGASPRWLGIPSEQRFIGKGVSSCATCDGAFFKGRDVIVVGGGDTAMEDSTFLTRFAKSVTIVHRRDKFRASKIMQDRALSNPKIRVIWNSAVEEIRGDEKVNGVTIRNLLTDELTRLDVQGVFVAIGYAPNTKFLEGKLELDDNGYIKVRDEVHSAITGVFIAGDAADPVYRQAVSAAGSGAKAAIAAREYLQSLG
ncbi:MAG: thioredoxin-disulfide reductase [Candidatus Marsarchaeota archaeon]|nr:thioredoxin-disulfide reductase [Candidatus Marsarchaeota archaeon]